MAATSAEASKILANQIGQCVRLYQEHRPKDHDTVLEILDALAFITAAQARGIPRKEWRGQLKDRFIANMEETIRELGGHAH